MLRVLLVLEDYGETVFLQILLTKLGFDVDSVKNPKVLQDSVTKVNPDVVLITARGKRINGCELSGHIKRVQGRPKIVLMAPIPIRDKLTKADIQHVDALCESPVSPTKMIEVLAMIGDFDQGPLIEKYKKLKPQLAKNSEIESAYLQGGESTFEAPEVMDIRGGGKSKYEKFLKLDSPPPVKTFNKAKVVDVVKELRREPLDPDLDHERQEFVKALFKKKA